MRNASGHGKRALREWVVVEYYGRPVGGVGILMDGQPTKWNAIWMDETFAYGVFGFFGIRFEEYQEMSSLYARADRLKDQARMEELRRGLVMYESLGGELQYVAIAEDPVEEVYAIQKPTEDVSSSLEILDDMTLQKWKDIFGLEEIPRLIPP